MCAFPVASDGPIAQEESLSLFHQEVRLRLSPTALALLLLRAEVFVEGGAATGASAQGSFFGSAMMTLDLAACRDRLRTAEDAETAERLRLALVADKPARAAVKAHAIKVARARLSVPSELRCGELSMRVDGGRLLIDLELEARGGTR